MSAMLAAACTLMTILSLNLLQTHEKIQYCTVEFKGSIGLFEHAQTHEQRAAPSAIVAYVPLQNLHDRGELASMCIC
jgi:hypothetical protein